MAHQNSIIARNTGNLNRLFPPRPELAIHPKFIAEYDNGTFAGQLKLNGACGVLHIDSGTPPLLFERDRLEPMTVQRPLGYHYAFKKSLGSAVIIGEYMNKNKRGFDGLPFNHKFVINDIIGLDGVHIKGVKFEDRMELLDKLLIKPKNSDNYLFQYTDDIYRVQNINTGFARIYEEYTKYDMVEGLIIKRLGSVLTDCYNKKNGNSSWQFKFRKPTNCYKF